MALDISIIQEQVVLQTNKKGIGTHVIGWTNRVMQAVAREAFWPKQMRVVNMPVANTATNATTVVSQWFSLSTASTLNPIAIRLVEQVQGAAATPVMPLVRHDARELYHYFEGANASQSSASVRHYAVPRWISATSGAATQNYMVPQIALFPLANTTNTNTCNFSFHILCAPDKLTAETGASGGSTHWMITQYWDVILHGVLVYAHIYCGNWQGALFEKAEFKNKLQTMMQELRSYAGTPHREGVFPGDVVAGGNL